jgi:hypothetical protein
MSFIQYHECSGPVNDLASDIHKVIVALAVQEILGEHIAKKLV